MNYSNYLSINGSIIDENQSADMLHNRGFLFGDGFFESMHWHNNKILFVEDHLERINNAFRLLKFDQSGFNFNQLMDAAKQLLIKNRISGDARIRMTFYRISEGNYTPVNNKNGNMISVVPLTTNGFVLDESGLNIGLFQEQTKSRSSLSNIKTLNSLVYVLAGIHAKENKWDDVLIFNDVGNILEAHTSNIFITVDNMLLTPPLSDGCVDGVMRKQVIKLANQNGITVKEKSIFPQDIEYANEILLTNAVQGIRLVSQCKSNNYNKVFAEKLFSILKKQVA